MKCPHCEYEHGWNSDYIKLIEGDCHGFYLMPIEMHRVRSDNEFYYEHAATVSLYACPSCMKTFVE